MFTKVFLTAVLERAFKTLLQTFIALVGVNAVNLVNTSTLHNFEAAVTAAVLSVLTSYASANIGSNGGPSLANEAIVTTPELAPATAPVA